MAKLSRIERLAWIEFVQAKSWEQYISEYTGHKIDRRKWYNVAALFFAVSGGASWGFWKSIDAEWVTPIMFLLLGISQLLAAIQKDIVLDNETLESLTKLRAMYIAYSNKLERLVVDILDKRRSREEVEAIFYELRETVYPIEALKDTVNIKSLKSLNKNTNKKMEGILKSKFNVEY